MKGGGPMKKLSTVLLLALVALTACAWTAKGTGTQPAESKPTKPPAVAARRILGLVHHGRAQQYDIIGLQGVIVALDEMGCTAA